MRAAAAGNSTLGIPASVGQEYVRADRAQRPVRKERVGGPFVPDQAVTERRRLLLKRSRVRDMGDR